MTSAEVAAIDSPILIVPIGSFEQHGPHLPLDTDTRIAIALSDVLCRHLAPHALVGPPITVTASGEHRGFAGTLSIGSEATVSVIVELARSATWADRVVFVNGHGGNADALARVRQVFADEGRRVLVWSPSATIEDDAHAGRTETSVIAHLHPEAVDWTRVTPGRTTPIADLASELRTGGVGAVSVNGVLGDPTGADAARGRSIFERWTRELVDAVERWRSSP